MPLYEYECARCGRFEIIQKFSDPLLLTCPTCGREVQKLLSAPAIQFKGTGWYITDYARKSTGKGGESKGGESKGGESKGAESGGSGAKDGGSSSTDTASKAESGTRATASTKGAKGSSGGGSTS